MAIMQGDLPMVELLISLDLLAETNGDDQITPHTYLYSALPLIPL